MKFNSENQVLGIGFEISALIQILDLF